MSGFHPSYQWFQWDNPRNSHEQVEWSLKQNRPPSDDLRQACDECGPKDDEQQDQGDAR
jgi:hypothetical protein